MVCRQCGTQLPDNAIVCSLCGYKLKNVITPDYIQKQVMDMLQQESPEKPVEEHPEKPVEEHPEKPVEAHLEKPVEVHPDKYVREQQGTDARVDKEEDEQQERNAETAESQNPNIESTGETDRSKEPNESLETETETVQTQEMNKKEIKKQIPPKKMTGLVAVAAAVAVIIGIVTVSIRTTGDESRNRIYPMAYAEDNEDVLVLLNAKAEKRTVWYWDGICVPSADGSIVVYNEDGILYCAGSSLEPVEVDEDVDKVYVGLTGGGFAYLKEDDGDFYSRELYLYDVKSGKRQKVASDVYPYYICVSPDGKHVAYMKGVERSEDGMDSSLYVAGMGGDPEKAAGDGSVPMAVSDDGKRLFYIKAEMEGSTVTGGSLYYYDGKDAEKLSSGMETALNMYVNRDVTEAVYDSDGKTYYYSTKKQESQRINSNTLTRPGREDMLIGDFVKLYDVDSLTDSFYMAGGDVVWLNKDGTDTVKVSSDAANVLLSKDGHSCLYLNGVKIYRASSFSASAEPECVYDETAAVSYAASEDLSVVYATTEDGELYYCGGKTEPELISDDIENPYNAAAYNEQDKMVYFLEDDSLYRAKDKAGTKELVARDAVNLKSGDGIWYVTEDGSTGTIFWINSGRTIGAAECDVSCIPVLFEEREEGDTEPILAGIGSVAFGDSASGETAETEADGYAEGAEAAAEPEDYEAEEPEEEAQSEYVMPGSDSRYLTMDDLDGLSALECRIVRNEIYARHGRRFDDEALQAFFDAKSWYNGTIAPADFDESVLNEYETANRDLIVQYEQQQGYR